jgi:hypothetical protein
MTFFLEFFAEEVFFILRGVLTLCIASKTRKCPTNCKLTHMYELHPHNLFLENAFTALLCGFWMIDNYTIKSLICLSSIHGNIV